MSFNVVDRISEAEDEESCVRSWRRIQRNDSIIGAVHRAVSNGKKQDIKALDAESKRF